MLRASACLPLLLVTTLGCSRPSDRESCPAPTPGAAVPTAAVSAAPAVAVAVSGDSGTEEAGASASASNPLPASAAARVAQRAAAFVDALHAKDMRALAALVHPDRGLRFSPYSYVDMHDVRLTRAQIAVAMTDPAVRHWGDYDGSGEPIDLTFAQYQSRFVWDADFTKAHPQPSDFAENTIDNAKDFYAPDGIVVAYYLDGNPARDGMDWRALRLVMAPKDGDYYVEGIIHADAEWTI
jgi:hypothetical protein